MVTTVSTAELSEQVARRIAEAYARGDEFVVEEDGRRIASWMPANEYERWKERRDRAFAVIDRIHERNKHLDPEEVERDVAEAVREVREEAYRKAPG